MSDSHPTESNWFPEAAAVRYWLPKDQPASRKNITLDPARFANGFYTLRVVASDFGGLQSEFNHDVEINSIEKSGALFESSTDLVVTLDGLTIPIQRISDSLVMTSKDSAFGTKWTLPLLDPQLSMDTGEVEPGNFPAMTDRARVYLTLPTGQRVGFSFTPVDTSVGNLQTFTPAWTADSGTSWQLQSYGVNLRKRETATTLLAVDCPTTRPLFLPIKSRSL